MEQVEYKKIEKINKIAKDLFKTGLAKTMDDAVKMAEEIVNSNKKTMNEEIRN